MKTVKKIIAMLLMLMLVFSLAAPAFAEGSEESRYKNYFLIGDSVAIKCRADRADKSGYLRFSQDSYGEIIAKHYNIPAGFCDAYTGWRTQDARITIDPNYEGDIYTTDWQPRWGVEGNIDVMHRLRDTAIPALQKADLITVNLGNNNVIGTLAYSAAKVFEDKTAGTEWEQAAIKAIDEAIEKNSDVAVLASILEAAELMGQLKILIDTVIIDLMEALKAFPESWDNLIARIRELNPDAPMVVIGMYTSVGSDIRYLAEEYGINTEPLNLLVDAINEMSKPPVQLINYTMQTGSAYKDEYIFVDNMDADFTGTPDGHHMGPAGHAKLAEKIIAALDKNYEESICTHQHTTTVNAKAATIFTKGYSGDKVCIDCGQTVEKGSVTTFSCSHTNTVRIGAIPSTYITLGFSGTLFCKDCGKLLDLGHILGFKEWK